MSAAGRAARHEGAAVADFEKNVAAEESGCVCIAVYAVVVAVADVLGRSAAAVVALSVPAEDAAAAVL